MLYRSFALVTCFALFNMSVPYGAVVTLGVPFKEAVQEALAGHTAAHKTAKSHEMTQDEQCKTMGKTGECPYVAGQNKWDVIYRGVNLLSGNYSTSVTDMSFDGGYGIPVNVTRSYSANDGSDEPFGKGWSLSADVRSTAGGVIKSPSAPVKSVPVGFQERNTSETDPNVAVQPPAAVTATDAAGKQETIQKDVDGILTTPPWDNNVSNPTYGWQTLAGVGTFQVQTGNQTTTTDGTVYTYAAEGYYTHGTLPYNASQITPAPTAQAANVLKVVSVTDRQGNVTTYHYGTTAVTFNKMDGQTTEFPLTTVSMPNGHVITFTWGNGTSAPTNKIVSITDGTRTVSYGYSNDGAGNYLLTSVNVASNYLPAGKTTTYYYGAAATPTGWTGDDATDLLTGIKTPQGLLTSISYLMGYVFVAPYNVTPGEGVQVFSVTQPNGNYTSFGFGAGNVAGCIFGDSTSSNGQTLLGHGQVTTLGGTTFTVTMENSGTVSSDDIIGRYLPYWTKSYDPNSENLLTDVEYSYVPMFYGPLAAVTHNLKGYGPTVSTSVTTSTNYNFMGNPLSKQVTEDTVAASGYTAPPDFTHTESYAYWDGTKYFQQKGTLDQGGRYSYTDYYPTTAAAGSRGQQYEVFDNAHAGFYLNTNITPPPGTAQADYWKYQLTPTAGQYTAQFAYDSVGRCTDAFKLQKTTTNPWTYVDARTTYGGAGSPTWGQATQVVEDQGGINRTTSTTDYTSWGKPDKVEDAATHIFSTAYDYDGTIQSVTRIDSGLNQNLVSYSYGTTVGAVNYGQPTLISDGLSGVSDSITYDSTTTDGGYGQPSQVSESGGQAAAYSVNYTFDAAGDRQTATYTTPNGTQRWGYYDYVRLGSPESGKRGFQTMNKLYSNGTRSTEEMHYAFDSQGKLYCGAFAQTPQTGQSNYETDPAACRCRVFYGCDPSGRILSATHWWETWNSGTSSFSEEAVIDNECAYEVNTGLDRGLKISSAFYKNTAQGSSAWTHDHTETYGYDANFDYLTGANYGDGLPNQTPSWAYDPAGNRTDSVCDNLNRTTSVGGVFTTCDILGNRLTLGSASYGWDCLNRMTSNSTGYNYTYRADGMRIYKVNPTTTNGVTYRYDGQMGIEDISFSGSNVNTIDDYGLGARGIDYIASTSSGTTTVGFPIYDAHGNMTACLFRTSGSNYYTINNQRHYDAWGIIRNGATTGDPKGRYCASLGHKQDDESGLIYMRARYYETGSGRFLSQDPGMNGRNFFCYAGNDPVDNWDTSGRSLTTSLWCFLISLVATLIASYFISMQVGIKIGGASAIVQFLIAATADVLAARREAASAGAIQLLQTEVATLQSAATLAAENSLAGPAVEAVADEAGQDVGELIADDMDNSGFTSMQDYMDSVASGGQIGYY